MLLDLLLSPGATGLPIAIEWLGGLLGITIAGVITRVQFMRGKKDATTTTVPAELAGAVISHQKADEIVGSINSLGRQMVEVASALRATSRALGATRAAVEENTVASRASAEQIEQARTDVRELTREIVRSSGRT